MSKDAFVGGWRTFATGTGPQLFPDVYYALPADVSKEAWVTLVPGKWRIASAAWPPKKPVNHDPDNVYFEVTFGLFGTAPRPQGLHWNPRNGQYVVATWVAGAPKHPTPDPRVPGPVVLPDELLRRLAVLDKLLADGIITQELHDEREAEIVREFT